MKITASDQGDMGNVQTMSRRLNTRLLIQSLTPIPTHPLLNCKSYKGRNEGCPAHPHDQLIVGTGQKKVDCLRRNADSTWPALRMSEVREVEGPKIMPVFLAQVNAAGV